MSTTPDVSRPPERQLLSKVPEVTIYFWIIKILCTTVGESAADYLNTTLNLGLTGTSVITGLLLVVALFFQFRAERYVPVPYWVTVAVISVFGTLVTDNMTDKLGIPLATSTIVFSVLLGLTFVAWYLSEKTLSIHSIYTSRRETFYWFAVLFSFALGTATGDLMAEDLAIGYLATAVIVASLIALTAVAWKLGLNAILSFWIIYILTRPLGASIGDYLSQPTENGGLGLGSTVTSVIFFAAIIGVVAYLTITRADIVSAAAEAEDDQAQRGGLMQTIIVLALVLIIGGTAYQLRRHSLESTTVADPGASASATLGDMSSFQAIVEGALAAVDTGDQSSAKSKASDLETEWDAAQARLKSKNLAEWNNLDHKIDSVLSSIRSGSPNQSTEQVALNDLLAALG